MTAVKTNMAGELRKLQAKLQEEELLRDFLEVQRLKDASSALFFFGIVA